MFLVPKEYSEDINLSVQAIDVSVDSLTGAFILPDSIVDRDSIQSEAVLGGTNNQFISSQPEQKSGISLPVKLSNSDGLFSLFFICFLFLCFSYRGISSLVRESLVQVFSASRSAKLSEKTVTSKETFNLYFLVFIYILLISISAFTVLERIYPIQSGVHFPFISIVSFCAFLLLFVLLKLGFNKLIGYVFDAHKEIMVWNLSYLTLLGSLGLFCFIPILFLVYSNFGYNIIIGILLILFLIVHLFLIIKIIFHFRSKRFSILFLIAYLCTVEIIPYIFVGVGLVHLYKVDNFFNTTL